MEYRIIISSFVSLTALILGIYIYRQDPKSTPNRLALLICVCMVERYVNSVLMSSFDFGKDGVILLFNLNSSFYRALFPMFLHFYISLKEKKPLAGWKLLLIYIPALLVLPIPIIFHENTITVVFSNGAWKFMPSTKPNIWTNMVKWNQWVYFFAAILTAFLYWKKARLNREKKQAAVLLITNVVYLAVLLIIKYLRADSPRSFDLSLYPRMILLFGLYYAVFRYRFLAPEPSLVAENIIAHISDMVVLLDTRFRIITANKTAAGILSANPAESLKGRDFFGIIRPDSDIRKKLADFPAGSGDSFNIRLAYEKPGEEPIITESYFSRIKDKFNDTVGVLVISRQLLGRKEFQKMYGLSNREIEIVDLILTGHSARVIGEKLKISERTVESHFVNIYNKLGVSNKAGLFNLSTKFNLITS